MTSIQLSVPAHAAFVGLVRTSAAHIGAHVNLSVDQIEDLRLAVDEAFAAVLCDSPDVVDIEFQFDNQVITAIITGPRGGHEPDKNGFGWTVLTALVSDVNMHTSTDGRVTISLTTKATASA
ncbi:MAG: anti-sigma regulatory factor [Actinomycetes bacterium]